MTTSVAEKKVGTGQTDVSLLLSRLEKRILTGPLEKPWKEVLHNLPFISRLTPTQQVRLAGLAQMAGEMDAALEIYTQVNRSDPGLESAWVGRLELLSTLDRKNEYAAALGEVRALDNEALYGRCQSLERLASTGPLDDETAPVDVPFEKLHLRRAFLKQYAALFQGREDCFARQWVNRSENASGYVPVRRKLTHGDIEDHLAGRRTYGIYLFSADGTVRTGVLDVDIKAEYRGRKLDMAGKRSLIRQKNYLLSRIREISRSQNMTPLLEFSGGKGYHFWYFFDQPAEPAVVRSVLEEIKRQIVGDVPAFNIEVFPKQDKLTGKGFGNLVKLPLGVHRLTGKKSYFIDDRGAAVGESAQAEILSKVCLISPRALKSLASGTNEQNIIVHPGLKQFAQEYPELYRLESSCPPLGQLLVECRNHRALTMREEKIIYQTIGFLQRGKILVHYLFSGLPDYNPHLVDYRLGRTRGTPLGCKRIHSLMNVTSGFCEFKNLTGYSHPLLHLPQWRGFLPPVSEKVENLSMAVEKLKLAIIQVERFLK